MPSWALIPNKMVFRVREKWEVCNQAISSNSGEDNYKLGRFLLLFSTTTELSTALMCSELS